VRLGLIVRASPTGLGNQTWEAYRHLNPSVTVAVHSLPYEHLGQDQSHFPDAIWTDWRGMAPPRHLSDEAYEALRSCDVVWSAETPYDWRLLSHPGLVLMINPEFWRPEYEPVTLWSATSWRREFLPGKVRVIPMPVATDRLNVQESNDPPTFLHIAGVSATADRNGTLAFVNAAKVTFSQRPGMRFLLTAQSRVHSHPKIEFRKPTKDYWELYQGADILVMPRKFGGLCLPAQEAMASGLGLVMTNLDPQRQCWPIVPVTTDGFRKVITPAGHITAHEPSYRDLARIMVDLHDHPEARAQLRERSLAWRAANSWEALLPLWLEELQSATLSHKDARLS